MAAIYNSDNPDLSKFKKRGGKLILWHGWADAIVTPQKTIDYYEALESKMGGREKTQSFFRLFMVLERTTAACFPDRNQSDGHRSLERP